MTESTSRPALVAARRRQGWTQPQAADKIQVALTTWQRWEWGQSTPRTPQIARIARAFGMDCERVHAWFSDQTEPADTTPGRGSAAASSPDQDGPRLGEVRVPWLASQLTHPAVADTVEAASHLWRWNVDPSRRALLASLPFVPEALHEWAFSITLDPSPDSRAHCGSGRAVGVGDVHRLYDAVDAFVTMDHQFGGKLTRPAVCHFLDSEVTPLLQGRYSDEVGSQLMSAAASMTALAGWEAYDLAEHGLAQAHYGQALALAKAADDPLTLAWILATVSQQACDLHEPRLAVRLARAAQAVSHHSTSSPRVRAMLLVREARALAVGVDLSTTPDLHTVARVERLLGAAEDSFAAAAPGDHDPRWASDTSRAELTAEAGFVRRMIGHHQRAADDAQTALEGFDPRFVRSRQFNLIHRGRALLELGELDAALDIARQALPLSINQRSARSLSLVKSFNQCLTPHDREPVVIDWREHLRTVVPSVA
jgi:transcriptional regulator with XRE-family HTH domain